MFLKSDGGDVQLGALTFRSLFETIKKNADKIDTVKSLILGAPPVPASEPLPDYSSPAIPASQAAAVYDAKPAFSLTSPLILGALGLGAYLMFKKKR